MAGPWDGRLGITRVARVTGLDRVGVEVACAVRPGGHILQVCNGKGESFERAALGARMETAELWAAEHVDPARLTFGCAQQMREAFARAVILGPGVLAEPGLLTPEDGDPEGLRCAWVKGRDLVAKRVAYVPAWAVHCPPVGAPLLGLALAPWTTNGMGAHPLRAAALAHALFEAVERDQLARALPEGWTEEGLAAGRVAGELLSKFAPGLAAWQTRLRERSLELMLFDLTLDGPGAPKGGLGAPLAAALLFDLDRGPIPLAAGYACAPTLKAALRSAFLEAAQSRLTDIHGAREDIAPADPEQVEAFREACTLARAAPGSVRRQVRRFQAAPLSVPELLGRMQRAGHGPVVAVDLAPSGWGLHVFKVLVPGLLLSELL